MYDWPPGILNEQSVDAFVELFVSLGYEVCADGSVEAGKEKVAIYALGDVPTHAAILRPDGRWSSKWGTKGPDIWHATEGVLAGPAYGEVVQYMCKSV
jgi:hypothetical protein